MTGQDIIDFYQTNTVDNTTEDSTDLLGLLNVGYQLLLADRDWHFLFTESTSNTIAANDKTYSLPTDLLKPIRIVLVDPNTPSNYEELFPVPYAQRFEYTGDSRRFYVDYKNSQFVLLANPTQSQVGKTVHFEYLYKPEDLTLATSPVFLSTYHALVAYYMARHYWYKEQDLKSRSWNGEMMQEYAMMMDSMRQWDDSHQNFNEPSQWGVSPYQTNAMNF
jgi:hypothetical protein